MSCIQTRGLAYGQIRYNDLSIEGGKATFISGPSGSGKSTLLNLIAMLDSATEGEVIFEGKNILKLDSPGVPTVVQQVMNSTSMRIQV